MERSFLSDQTLQDTHFLIKDFGMERSNSLSAHFSTSHLTLHDTHFLSKKHLHLKSLQFWPPFMEAHFLEILGNSISIDQRVFLSLGSFIFRILALTLQQIDKQISNFPKKDLHHINLRDMHPCIHALLGKYFFVPRIE